MCCPGRGAAPLTSWRQKCRPFRLRFISWLRLHNELAEIQHTEIVPDDPDSPLHGRHANHLRPMKSDRSRSISTARAPAKVGNRHTKLPPVRLINSNLTTRIGAPFLELLSSDLSF